jgi:hypothetical protein
MIDLFSEYVPVFCPRCGEHLNEVDIETAGGSSFPLGRTSLEVLEQRIEDQGPSYRCGWCGINTTDWGHVKRCRRLGMAGSSGRMARTAVRLEALVARLEAMEEVSA